MSSKCKVRVDDAGIAGLSYMRQEDILSIQFG